MQWGAAPAELNRACRPDVIIMTVSHGRNGDESAVQRCSL